MMAHRTKPIDAFIRDRKARRAILSVLLIGLLAWVVWSGTPSHRVWHADEVPIAFWSWRLKSPAQEDVEEAIKQTGTGVLFLRAGQIDYEKDKMNCIRRVKGRIPSDISVHLAYNATRSLLAEFEQSNIEDLSGTVLGAFTQDLIRANDDRAHVVGLQLDFDVPTRLLSKYARLLQNIRRDLPDGMQLSITGLPTWLESTILREALSACDFWIPQFYGTQVPDKLSSRIPISSAEYVSSHVSRSRELGVPFYAGLAGYGYAIHYSKEGLLIELRGDLDPALVSESNAFDLSNEMPFVTKAKVSTELQPAEWRLTYRARRNVILDGAAIGCGETILIDRPTAAGLRACAAKVREQAGARLLGICVFRMPTSGDPTTLTLAEIASALTDTEPHFLMDAKAVQFSNDTENKTNTCVVELKNAGAAALRSDEREMIALIKLPANCLASVSVDGPVRAQPVFAYDHQIVNCAVVRANAVGLAASWWPPGTSFTARFETKERLSRVEIAYAGTLENGSMIEESKILSMP